MSVVERLRAVLAELLGVDDGPNLTWYIGLGLALLGGLGINSGANLIKLGHMRAICGGRETGRTTWWFGLTLFIIGNLANFTAASFTPATTITAVGSVQLISNVVFATAVLGEKLSWPVALGTVVITLGDVLMVGSGTHHSRSYTSYELQQLFLGRGYSVYVLCMAAVSVCSYVLYMRLWEEVARAAPAPAPWPVVKSIPVLYAVHSAAVGTQAIIMAKCLALLCKAAVTGPHRWDEVETWFTYTLAAALLAIGTFWVRSLNKGLRMFPALIIVPIMQCCWILFGVLAGGLFFNELDDFSRIQAVGFGSGLLLLLAGVGCISPNHTHPSKHRSSHGPETTSALHQRLLPEDQGVASAPGIAIGDATLTLTLTHPRLLSSRLSWHMDTHHPELVVREAGGGEGEQWGTYEGDASLLSLPAYAGVMFVPVDLSCSPPRSSRRTRSLDVPVSSTTAASPGVRSGEGSAEQPPRNPPDRTTTL